MSSARVLLDTHAFLWFITSDPKLSASADRAIRTGRNRVLLSVASLWEICIKTGLGKLPIPQPLDTFLPAQLAANRIEVLPILSEHAYAVAQLPLHHRDPFDRLLIVQALAEGLPILSADAAFVSYAVELIW